MTLNSDSLCALCGHQLFRHKRSWDGWICIDCAPIGESMGAAYHKFKPKQKEGDEMQTATIPTPGSQSRPEQPFQELWDSTASVGALGTETCEVCKQQLDRCICPDEPKVEAMTFEVWFDHYATCCNDPKFNAANAFYAGQRTMKLEVKHLKDTIESLRSQLEQAQKPGQWVKCSERLPHLGRYWFGCDKEMEYLHFDGVVTPWNAHKWTYWWEWTYHPSLPVPVDEDEKAFEAFYKALPGGVTASEFEWKLWKAALKHARKRGK